MVIKEIVKKHDLLSLETKLEFPVKKESKKADNFDFDMFLFLPYGLDINKHNFTQEDFYNSLKTHIRLSTPFYKLHKLIDGESSPYAKLQQSISEYVSLSNDKTLLEYEKQLKLFCSIFKAALRFETNKILRSRSEERRLQLVYDYKKNIKKSRGYFKNLFLQLNSLSHGEKAQSVFHYADEYQSLLVEKHTASLIKSVSKKSKIAITIHEVLSNIVIAEMDYRLEKNYLSVGVKKIKSIDLLHRSARLKKFIESNLYLNTDTKKEGVIVEQLLFSIAAGIAMVFATVVAFASQMLYGSLSLPFFIALVIGYMFKDRIKELVRLYLGKKHRKIIYDFKTKIYSQDKKKIGSLKESFGFDKYSLLSKKILDQRNKMRVTEITEESLGEKIIHYRTKVKIRKKSKAYSDFSGLTQIMRFNVSDFTKKMDDPEKEVLLRTKNGFKRVFSDRVYHLNLILTYSDNKDFMINSYKIFTNRRGISRIEMFKN